MNNYIENKKKIEEILRHSLNNQLPLNVIVECFMGLLEEQAAGFEKGLKEINQFKKKCEKEIEYLREAQKTQETEANKVNFAKDININVGMVEGLFHAEDIMRRAELIERGDKDGSRKAL